MYREHDVIQFNWIKTTGMSLEIFILDVSYPIKRWVENRVERVAQQVERQKVKVQADYRFPLEVVKNLGVEGDRPSDEVNPTDDQRNENYGRRMRNDNSNEKARVIDNTRRSCIPDDFNVSRTLPQERDLLHPVIVAVCWNRERIRTDCDHVMMVLVKGDDQWSADWSAGNGDLLRSNHCNRMESRRLTQISNSNSSSRQQSASYRSTIATMLSHFVGKLHLKIFKNGVWASFIANFYFATRFSIKFLVAFKLFWWWWSKDIFDTHSAEITQWRPATKFYRSVSSFRCSLFYSHAIVGRRLNSICVEYRKNQIANFNQNRRKFVIRSRRGQWSNKFDSDDALSFYFKDTWNVWKIRLMFL